MHGYLIQRLVALIPVLLVVATVVFLLVRLTPGDPAAVILGDQASAEAVRQLRARLGLDDPLPVQYGRWLANAVRGDLGNSLFFDRPVTAIILERVEPTVLLTLYGLLFGTALGVPCGVVAAVHHGRAVDRVLMAASLLGISTPSFVIGLLLAYLVSAQWNLLPAGGYMPVRQGFLGHLQSLLLPSLALGLVQFALIARMTRTAVLEVVTADHVRVAHAKGLPFRLVLLRHVLRNSLIPVVTIIGLSLAVLMGGTVVIETLFDIPGVGRLAVGSILRRDYPLVQGVVLYVTCAIALVNLLVDLAYSWLDPRIRY
jgi:peptide/nickel transport system permease protein